IFVFMLFVLLLVTILGSVMYLIEGGSNDNFDSIPRSVYWAIVTITTVGYGDIAPATTLGQFLAAALMVLGYAIIAVPTGIVSVELAQAQEEVKEELKEEMHELTEAIENISLKPTVAKSSILCSNCEHSGHDVDAEYCKYCGEVL
ncbi:MAG: potassium channel family protein, partial [Chitinophagales bacterium]